MQKENAHTWSYFTIMLAYIDMHSMLVEILFWYCTRYKICGKDPIGIYNHLITESRMRYN